MTNAKLGKKKPTVNKKKRIVKSLEKKLLSYSIAAGAAITATAENAHAVQYKDLNDVVIKNNETLPYFLDFNDDGINDFSIIHSGGSYSSYKVQFSGASIWGQDGNAFVAASKLEFIDKLEAGDLVDPVGKFVGRGNFGSLYSSNGVQTEYGNFLGSDNAFFGVRFRDSSGTSTHFGWARVSMPSDGSQITFHDLAYNENPGESILAGQGIPGSSILTGQGIPNTPVPEPGTLGMLALGAIGVIAWRKRKDKLSSRNS